jgi:hypothetical protein
MEVAFLTPLAGFVAFAVIVPLVAFVRSEQRVARVRSLLRLAAPGGSSRQTIVAIALLAALVGLGAAQPVLEQREEHSARTDAQAFFLLDSSRSMLASAGSGEASRFDRARRAARRMRAAMPEIPVGVATLTDRVLPNVFPSPNPETFDGVLRYSIGVDRPAAREAGNVRASALDATVAVPARRFFRGAKRRLLVVFTDAETRRLHTRELSRAFSDSGIETVLVRFWDAEERIHTSSGGEESYAPDPGSAAAADAYARAVGGRAFDEDELDEAIAAARSSLGSGRTSVRIEAADVKPLGPFVFLAALLPLSLLLWRRNLA